MTMGRRLRLLALTAHVTVSVGWLGAVLAFLGLAIVGMASHDLQTVRGTYLVMEPAAWFVLLPLALGSLLTGLVQSLGSKWGLFQHYWVVAKLLINAFLTLLLIAYMRTFASMAEVAANPRADLDAVRNPSPLLHAFAALVLLVTATALALYKPRGLTPYGWRKQDERARIS
jgi:uncharacterized membrane protein